MRATQNIALRPYLEAIRQVCTPLAKKKLLEMILTMAREVPAAERTMFQRLHSRTNHCSRPASRSVGEDKKRSPAGQKNGKAERKEMQNYE